MNEERKLSPWKPWIQMFCLCTRTCGYTLDFQMPQVIYITVNDSDELHVLSLLQALRFHVLVAVGVNSIPAAVVILEVPGVKQRWLGPVEVLTLVMLYQAPDLVICSVTTHAWNCFRETNPKSMPNTYSSAHQGNLRLSWSLVNLAFSWETQKNFTTGIKYSDHFYSGLRTVS